MKLHYTEIAEHWDTAGLITADSDYKEEFSVWRQAVGDCHSEWVGDEWTLEDFEQYIEALKDSEDYWDNVDEEIE